MLRHVLLLAVLRGVAATCAAGQNALGTNPGGANNINLCWQKNPTAYSATDSGLAGFNECDTPGFCSTIDAELIGLRVCRELAAANQKQSSISVTTETDEGLLGCQVDSANNYYFNHGPTSADDNNLVGKAWTTNNPGNTRQMICVTRDYQISNGVTPRDGATYNFVVNSYAGQAGVNTANCKAYLSPSTPPTSPPPPPPPPSPLPPKPPPTSPAPSPPPDPPLPTVSVFDPTILIAILIPVILLSLCCCCFLYYWFYWRPKQKAKYYAPVLTEREEQMRELFMLMDHDVSGYLDVDELRTVLAWLRDNVVGGNSGWLTVMWQNLPIADTEAGERPIVGDAKTNEDGITVKTDAIGASRSGADSIGDANDSVVGVSDLKFVEGGKMNLQQFTAWMFEVVSSFTQEMYEQMLTNLMAFLKKEQDAYRIFNAMDADGHHTLDVAELKVMLNHFKEEFETGEVVFKTVAQEEAEKLAELKVKQEAGEAGEAGDEGEASTAAPAAVTADIEAPASGPKASNYEEWMSTLVSSVEDLGSKELDLLGFKHWFFGHTDYLARSTYVGAIQPLLDVINRKVEAEDLFDEWDKDKSGSLDFKEMGEVLQWFHDNVPQEGGGKLDWAHLWNALTPPSDGKITKDIFKRWLVEITKRIHPETFQAITKKLKKVVGEDFQNRLKEHKEGQRKQHGDVTA